MSELIVSSSVEKTVEPLADIGPGKHGRKFVKARGKADIALEFSDPIGARHTETIVGYTSGGVQCNAHVVVGANYTVKSNVEYGPEKVGWASFETAKKTAA